MYRSRNAQLGVFFPEKGNRNAMVLFGARKLVVSIVGGVSCVRFRGVTESFPLETSHVPSVWLGLLPTTTTS